MCGIAGYIGRDAESAARQMMTELGHRGPDDRGLFCSADGEAALSHTRLSIIDTSRDGHQPMSFGRRFHIVFNGEVYNFRDLRADLERSGHRFSSHSDTEVVLVSYVQWGEACVERFRGMFAFAIYDNDSRSIFAARDRFGIKPFYYVQDGDRFTFASELRALLAVGGTTRKLDVEALSHYVGYGSVGQPRTILADVQALPAGHTLTLSQGKPVTLRRYWDLAQASNSHRQIAAGLDEHSAPQVLREFLNDATRLHVIADVPVGAFLSGGIDSSAVVGLMATASSSPIRTYSVGFNEQAGVADERAMARIVAERFGTVHTEVVVSGSEVTEHFDDLIKALDQPSLDGTNTYLVSRAAGRELKVALSGLGGDEIFSGYPHFDRLRAASAADAWLGRDGSLRRRLGAYVPGRVWRERSFALANVAERYASLRRLASEDEKAAILSASISEGLRASPTPFVESLLNPRLDSIAQTTYVEARSYLVSTLLRDADATAMHCSLEIRPVLLDHVLAEFVFALPGRLKQRTASTNKPLLVNAVRDLLPREVIEGRKLGFELPLQLWLIGPLRDRAIAAFGSSTARALFSSSFLTQTIASLEAKKVPSIRVWSYLILIEWLAAYRVTL